MYSFLILVHLLTCVLLTVVILLQSSKGGGLAGAFGGSSMGAVFGGRGAATFLSKVTIGLAVLFLVLSFSLGLMTSAGPEGSRVVAKAREQATQASSPAAMLPRVPGGSQGLGEAVPPATGQAGSVQPATGDTAK